MAAAGGDVARGIPPVRVRLPAAGDGRGEEPHALFTPIGRRGRYGAHAGFAAEAVAAPRRHADELPLRAVAREDEDALAGGVEAVQQQEGLLRRCGGDGHRAVLPKPGFGDFVGHLFAMESARAGSSSRTGRGGLRVRQAGGRNRPGEPQGLPALRSAWMAAYSSLRKARRASRHEAWKQWHQGNCSPESSKNTRKSCAELPVVCRCAPGHGA